MPNAMLNLKARKCCVRSFALPYHNWRRPLPRPIVIPRIMTLETLEDVRALVHRHLPTEYRAKQTWQRVASITSRQSPPNFSMVVLSARLPRRCRSSRSSMNPRR